MTNRCQWATTEFSIPYHDGEWGVPVHDDRLLFEMLTLEGAQAGLSWITVLRKREGYRKLFANFDVQKVARFTPKRVEKLMLDARIIRNRLKIESTITNAKAFIKVQEEFGSFDQYFWGFVDGKPIQNRWKSLKEIPAKTALSDTISKDLKRRGFKFVGSTVIYAHLQAAGLVNDHTVDCFRYKEIAKMN